MYATAVSQPTVVLRWGAGADSERAQSENSTEENYFLKKICKVKVTTDENVIKTVLQHTY